jgi:chaperonin cofactor prefoldin
MNGGIGAQIATDWASTKEAPGGAPSKHNLAQMLSEKRSKMLSELRDIEQALEALEHTPDFEPTFQRVLKILQRSY